MTNAASKPTHGLTRTEALTRIAEILTPTVLEIARERRPDLFEPRDQEKAL